MAVCGDIHVDPDTELLFECELSAGHTLHAPLHACTFWLEGVGTCHLTWHPWFRWTARYVVDASTKWASP